MILKNGHLFLHPGKDDTLELEGHHLNKSLKRISENCLQLVNEYQTDIKIFANEFVPIENSAVDELVNLIKINKTIDYLKNNATSFFENCTPLIEKISITPDFHKGAGIPIGTVLASRDFLLPQAIGNDINCGMRVYLTDYTEDDIVSNIDKLETDLRYIFFEGGRNIPMTGLQREALLREGISGLLNTTSTALSEGIWRKFHTTVSEQELDRIYFNGSLKSDSVLGLSDFIGKKNDLTRDNQIGSIGGGNHFVEIQKVQNLIESKVAYAWGLKKGQILIMVHSGSLMIGHQSGIIYKDLVKELYPKHLKKPDNDIYILPLNSRYADQIKTFWDTLNNSGNFAFCNRMFLGLMALQSIEKVCGEKNSSLLYDTPHNFVWEEELHGHKVFLHRKGACPARGMDKMQHTPFEYYGEPVIVPGSMGSSSYIMAGCGNVDSLWSASHGAGRSLSRGQALKVDDDAFKKFMQDFRVITPIDFRRQDIKVRKDIIDEKLADIKKEAPFAYKDITDVITTLRDSNISKPVVELKPILTIKG